MAAHREQAFDYWRGAADPEHNIPAPHFVVLCAFQRFEVWEPGDYPNEPAGRTSSSSNYLSAPMR